MLRPLRVVVVVVLSVCRAMRCSEHAGAIGCRGRPAVAVHRLAHARGLLVEDLELRLEPIAYVIPASSSCTVASSTRRSRSCSTSACVHAARRMLPALWRWCKLRGACGCIAQRYDALHCCDTVLPAFGRGRTLQRAVLRYVCPLPLVVTARCTVALPDVARCICACPQHVAPHGLSVAQYREWHLIVVRILLVSSCCMINSFFPIDTCSSMESPVGPIP